ncbi:hypothetical protein FJ208_00685 [Candidatus Gribaldobacteria bacterium]|nr:hypothetical protein [Candidatus Gribaldobacteria bacterium]
MQKIKINNKKNKIIEASPDKCFWVCNGEILKNLRELKVALEKMTNEIFSYHANNLKNDFAVWAEDVLGEKFLASQLKRAKTAKEMANKIKLKSKK